MEKGMSSGEGLPSRAPQASAAKVTVKESETGQPCEEKRGGFVLVHAGETLWVSWNGNQKGYFPFLAVKNTKVCISYLTKRAGTQEPVRCYSVSWLEGFTMVLLLSSLFPLSYLPYIVHMFGSAVLKPSNFKIFIILFILFSHHTPLFYNES